MSLAARLKVGAALIVAAAAAVAAGGLANVSGAGAEELKR